MQGKAKEQWIELCEQAAVEQDAERLLVLVSEINRMLDEERAAPEERQTRESTLPTLELWRRRGAPSGGLLQPRQKATLDI